ncbi:TIR domain-containing protein [Sphingomonas astaxanthinifaciens]|uniref:TIR domain-containing protein n=1 Tax=Sphingomonas astaxanthinifaciens DSM 22298 TaxID=1123267 RepID=A0ABQ5Z6Q5_9SPHN|nr:TIR domain-containing protein [Sphingomonas astaxanthinifaciens]GLR47086.1 hypothetical protein GCM10007925_07970 [Sphingomonas astaxanthinifaciens DSM 22298]
MNRHEDEGERVPHERYVFLSYCRRDQRTAYAVIKTLEEAGFKVWWDALIPGGHRFGSSISTALEGADAVVVLWSAEAGQSDWVKDEAGYGRDHHRLVPLSIDGTEPPLGFRQIQCIDISKGRGRRGSPGMLRAIAAIAEIMGHQPEPQARKNAGSLPVSRRTALIAGSALAVAGAGFAGWRWFGASSAGANSLAVLPFENLSGDASKTYLSDGLAAELRARLSRNPLLSVVGQASSNVFRDREASSADIARKLKVANLLDGNVRMDAQQIRIAVELIDGATGFSKWTQSFDGPLTNLLALQSQVAETVSSALAAELGAKDAHAQSGDTRNISAFEAYLRGKDLFDSQRDEASDRAALAQFTEAVRLDPDYAAARAARSRALAVIANQYAETAERRLLYDEAITEAREAISGAPEYAEGYAALGYALFYGKMDVLAADAPFAKAHDYGAGSAEVLNLYALYHGRRRNFAIAGPAIERAVALDPLNPALAKTQGRIRFASGDYVGAIAAARRALELNPDLGGAHGDIANALLLSGQLDEAAAEYARERSALLKLPGEAILAIRRGNQRAASAAFDQLVRDEGDNGLYQQAQVLAQWGKVEPALDALDKAVKVQDSGLVYLLSDPFLAPLHAAPRYKALLRALHFV